MQHLRNERRGSKQANAKDEVKDSGNGEVANLEQSQIDDRVWCVQLPPDGGAEADNRDGGHPADEGGAEPVVDLSAVEQDIQRSRAKTDERDADTVDVEPAIDANGPAFFLKSQWVMDKAVGEKQRQDTDGNVDEEDPTPVVIVGDPAAEDGPDGGRGDNGDGIQSEGAGPLGRRESVDQDGLLNGCKATSSDALQDARHEHDVERGCDAAEEACDGEETHAGHVVVLAAEYARKPGRHGQDNSVRDEIRGKDPSDFVKGAAKASCDIRQRYVGNGRVEQFHKRSERNRECNNPWVDNWSGYAHVHRLSHHMGPNGRIPASDGEDCVMGSRMLRIYAGGGMTKGEETRRSIIERAAPLFNQRGFDGCSMSDIMEATGLEKGGIYRHFNSKEEIAEAAFRHSVEASMKLRTAGIEHIYSPVEALRTMIARFVHSPSAVAGGCPLMNTAIDADDGNEILRGLVREAFKAWRLRVTAILERAVDAGEIQEDADIAWLSNSVIITLEGAVMLSRLERRKDPLLDAQRTLNFLLDSLLLAVSE